MLPTITAHGDAICVSKFYRRGKGVKVGDVVSFRHPMFPEFGAVKRVVGMPGDFVGRDSPGTGRGMMIQVFETFITEGDGEIHVNGGLRCQRDIAG